MLLPCCALALNPALDVSQYAHTSWKNREGFSKGYIQSIAQTPDGYLWLGTDLGLLRFDGFGKPVEWQPPGDRHLPSPRINNVLAARDGTLWISTAKGLASWKGGQFRDYPELAGKRVLYLLEDREGAIWAGVTSADAARLCAVQKGGVRCDGEDGRFGPIVLGLYEDRSGSLWAGAASGLWRWKPGPPRLYPAPGPRTDIQSLIEGDNGALWLAMPGGVKELVDGKIQDYPLAAGGAFRPIQFLRDREGGLWIGTLDRGIVHLHQGKTDAFAPIDGLSGEYVLSLFEDREGDIWVATNGGLDRFREFAVPTFSASQGLQGGAIPSVLVARDESVWLGGASGLTKWNHGQITVYGGRLQSRASGPAPVREVVGSGLPASMVIPVFKDDRGRLWVTAREEFGYLENDRFTRIRELPVGYVYSVAEDDTGNLWMAHQNAGLLRLSPGHEVVPIPSAKLGHKDYARVLAIDPAKAGLWLGFYEGGIAQWKDGQVRASFAASDGLGGGRVNNLRFDPDGALWAATEGGLSRVQNGRIATLTRKNGLPCDSVQWTIEDDARSLWLLTPCGLARLARPEVDAWIADPKRVLKAAVFDSADGVQMRSSASAFSPMAKSKDGRLWIAATEGVSIVDPRRLAFNNLPPPVHIERIVANRTPHDANGSLRLPPLIRDLEIDYTALSLVAPEKIRFRYKLEGHDPQWVDAGDRRQAFYTDLRPRRYRFRVIACNNSGVWNETGASFDFSIAPAYYQTTWFLVSCVAAGLALLGALHLLRVRYLAREFNVRLETRVHERTRIARELHDTLLQSFQGVLMKFSAVAGMIRSRPAEAEELLDTAVEQARQAITEGRDAVQGLRRSTVEMNSLAEAIGAVGEGLVCPGSPAFHVHVDGDSRDLEPLVRDEVHRVVCEAVRNAFRHAEAQRIDVELRYDRRQFRLRVRDDGKGIDQAVLNGSGRAGHFGLPGMQERARVVGGKLAVFSKPGAGTEIELAIPASFAYKKAAASGSGA
jgi:signal transduction histidine kinase/ligand-binding sensor domain-containing protein